MPEKTKRPYEKCQTEHKEEKELPKCDECGKILLICKCEENELDK